jgi:hypothetical protein
MDRSVYGLPPRTVAGAPRERKSAPVPEPVELNSEPAGQVILDIDDSSTDTATPKMPFVSPSFYPLLISAPAGVTEILLALSAWWYGRVVDPYGVLSLASVQLGAAIVGLIIVIVCKYRRTPVHPLDESKSLFKDSHFEPQLELYLGSILAGAITIVMLTQWEINFQSYKVWLDKMKVDALSNPVIMMRSDLLAVLGPVCFAQAWLFTKAWAAVEREFSPIYNSAK